MPKPASRALAATLPLLLTCAAGLRAAGPGAGSLRRGAEDFGRGRYDEAARHLFQVLFKGDPEERAMAETYLRQLPAESFASPPPAGPARDPLLEDLRRFRPVKDLRGLVLVFSGPLAFHPRREALRAPALRSLRRIVDILKRYPARRLVVEGHCDPADDGGNTEALALGRARWVEKALAEQGIPRDQIRTLGYGARRPAVREGSPAGRAYNRRVELVVLPAPSSREGASSLDGLARAVREGLHRLDGFYWQRHYGDMRRHGAGEDVYELRQDLHVETEIRLHPRVSAKFSVRAEVDQGADRDSFHPEDRRLELYEGYLDVLAGAWEARLGSQVLRWGKGDEFNPVDNFTPEDFREFYNLERAQRKRPIPAVRLKRYVGSETFLEGLWLPFFQENLFAEPGQDWEFSYPRILKGQGYVFLPEDVPAKTRGHSSAAGRLVQRGSWGDWSLSYAYHFDQNPALHVTINPLFFLGLAPSPGTVQTKYKRLHSVGTDFEAAYRDWGFRGEMVYTPRRPFVTSDVSDADLVVDKDMLQYLLGFDFTYRSDNYVNLQLLQTSVFRREPGMAAQGYNANLLFRAFRKFLHDRLKIQLTGQYSLTDTDYYYEPELVYELREGWELNAGAFLFEGDRDGFFGQFDDNDQVYLNLRYHF